MGLWDSLLEGYNKGLIFSDKIYDKITKSKNYGYLDAGNKEFFAPKADREGKIRARDFVREMGGFAKEVVQGTARNFARGAMEIDKQTGLFGTITSDDDTLRIEGKLGKAIFGRDEIDTAKKAGTRGLEELGLSKESAEKYGYTAGMSVVLADTIPMFGGSTGRNALKIIAKTDDAAKIGNIITKELKGVKIAAEDVPYLSKILRKVKDEKVVQSVITDYSQGNELLNTRIGLMKELEQYTYLKKIEDGQYAAKNSTTAVPDEILETEAGYRVLQEVAPNQLRAGKRVIIEGADEGFDKWVSDPSTFPEWVPPSLRRKEYFEKAYPALSEGRRPAGAAGELYDEIVREIMIRGREELSNTPYSVEALDSGIKVLKERVGEVDGVYERATKIAIEQAEIIKRAGSVKKADFDEFVDFIDHRKGYLEVGDPAKYENSIRRMAARYGIDKELPTDDLVTELKKIVSVKAKEPAFGREVASVRNLVDYDAVEATGKTGRAFKWNKEDRATVEMYKKMIKNGEDVGSIKVVREDGKLGVIDGKHRLQAYKELGYDRVPIEIVEGHGKVAARLSTKDQKLVERIAKEMQRINKHIEQNMNNPHIVEQDFKMINKLQEKWSALGKKASYRSIPVEDRARAVFGNERVDRFIEQKTKEAATDARKTTTAQFRNYISNKLSDIKRREELGKLKGKILQREVDTIKREIVEHAKTLPLREKGKLLATVKNARTRDHLEKAVIRIGELGTNALKKNLTQKITKKVKQIMPRKLGGVNPREYFKISKAEAQKRIADNWEKAVEGVLPPRVRVENAMLEFADLKNMSNSELKEALAKLEMYEATGFGKKMLENIIPKPPKYTGTFGFDDTIDIEALAEAKGMRDIGGFTGGKSLNLSRMMFSIDNIDAEQAARQGWGGAVNLYYNFKTSELGFMKWQKEISGELHTIFKGMTAAEKKALGRHRLGLSSEALSPKMMEKNRALSVLTDRIHKEYNEWARMNGLEEMDYVPDYLRKVSEKGPIAVYKKTKPTDTFTIKRKDAELPGKQETDALKIMLGYTHNVGQKMYMDGSMMQLKQLTSVLNKRGDMRRSTKFLNDFVREYMNPSNAENFAENIANMIISARTTAALLGNPVWTLTVQPMSASLIIARNPSLAGLKGMAKAFIDKGTRKWAKQLPTTQQKAITSISSAGLGDASFNILKPRRGGRRETFNAIAGWASDAMENNLSLIAASAAREHGKKLGMEGRTLDIYADMMIGATQSEYIKSARPAAMKSVWMRLASAFQTFAFEGYDFLKTTVGAPGGGIPIHSKVERIKQLTYMVSTMMAMDWMQEKVSGRRTFRPGSLIPIIGSITDDAFIRIARTISGNEELGSEVFSSTGFAPTQPIAPLADTERMLLAFDDAIKHGDFTRMRREAVKWGMGFSGVGGASTVNRFWDGVEDSARGFSKTASGRERFRIDGTDEQLKAIIFGSYSTKAGQEYLDKGESPKIPSKRSVGGSKSDSGNKKKPRSLIK